MAKKAKTAAKAKTARKPSKPARPQGAKVDQRKLERGVRAAVAAATSGEPPPPPPFAGTLRAINASFVRALPQHAVSTGVHEPGKDAPVEAKGVPAGRYRVDGSDFIIVVKGEKVVTFEKATPMLDAASVVAIPSHA